MLNLTEEEYGMLMATPAWGKLIDQISQEVHLNALDIANGTLLSSSMEETAIQYATNVGRLSALIDLFNYRPDRTEEPLNGEEMEKELM